MLSPDLDFPPAGGVGGCAGHAGGGVVHDDRAVRAEGDEAAVVGLERFVKDVVNGGGQRLFQVGEAGGDVVGHGVADELLADAGAAYGAGRVVGVSPRADDWRVADAAIFFVRDAAGGGAGGQVARAIEGDAADGAVMGFVGSDW